MYKQCFELLTAQGPKPHKSFSVASGVPEVTKELDPELKGSIFSLCGQKIQLPPNPAAQMATDFHNTGAGTVGSKKIGVTSSLNIVHQFLIFQVYVPEDQPFSIELSVRDKHNGRRKISFLDSISQISVTQTQVKVPTTMIARERWTNLCIDVNSFIRECFTQRGPGPYGTPQIPTTGQLPPVTGQRAAVGGGSGDIAALHGAQVKEFGGSKIAAVLAKNAEKNIQNSMKVIEVIQLEGTFKIRKIFTSRSQIPADIVDPTFGNTALVTTSGLNMRAEDIIQAAMSGQRIEQVPKNFDFSPQVEKLNQVISYEIVNAQHMSALAAPHDHENKPSGSRNRIPAAVDQQSSNIYATNNAVVIGLDITSDSGLAPYQQNSSLAVPIRNALRGRGPLRGSGKDRKLSIGGAGHLQQDVGNTSQNSGNSPFPKGGIVGSMISLNTSGQQVRGPGGHFGKINNAVVGHSEACTGADQHSTELLRNSGISIRQGPPGQSTGGGKFMKINVGGIVSSNDSTPFDKAANLSSASNHGQRSIHTQSTAYSVRTTSSGNQAKSQSNNKRSQNTANGRPVYEQVEEMVEESGSLHIAENSANALQENSIIEQEKNGNAPAAVMSNSPKSQSAGPTPQNQNAQSAKVKRTGFPRTNLDTNLPKTTEKMSLLRQQDPLATPKLHQLQEVHQTTILEENETLRGSMDRQIGLHVGSGAVGGPQKQKKRTQIVARDTITKPSAHLSAAGARKTPVTGAVFGKNARTKSNVDGNNTQYADAASDQPNHNNTPQLAQSNFSKAAGGVKVTQIKQSMSSANLEDNIEGVIGAKLQNRNNGKLQGGKMGQNKAISPLVVARKQGIPKAPHNQLQLSAQKKQRGSELPAPQFQVCNSSKQGPNSFKNSSNAYNNNQAQYLYHGSSAYGSNQMGGGVDSDGDQQSDFKTTTLRFTNNNFINSGGNDPSSSQQQQTSYQFVPGAAGQQHQPSGGNSLLNTLNSQQNNAQQNGSNFKRNNSKQFGTSENFKRKNMTGAPLPGGNQAAPIAKDQRTDGFTYNGVGGGGVSAGRPQNGSNLITGSANNQYVNSTKSPMYKRQFSTLHNMVKSDGQQTNFEDEMEQEEMIEEDICGHGESPLINAQTKQATGKKAKQLFHGVQPPLFRSTESDQFQMDTAMTGFGPMAATNKGSGAQFHHQFAANVAGAMKDTKTVITPMQDKSSILASKPFIGGKLRHQMIKSPNRSFNSGYNDLNSAGGPISEMRHQQLARDDAQQLQREIEEDIRAQDEARIGCRDPQNPYNMLDDSGKSQNNKQMEETCTSDFYQVPIQGGIPVQLTIENGRRPFTPPFAQLIRVVNKPPTGQSNRGSGAHAATGANNSVAPVNSTTNANGSLPKMAPDWIKSESNHIAIKGGPIQVMSNEQKAQLKNEILLVQDGMMDEPIIEEEIEGTSLPSPAPITGSIQGSKQATTVNASSAKLESTSKKASILSGSLLQQPPSHHQLSGTGSRNKDNPTCTFAEEQIIEFSESFKHRELKIQLSQTNNHNTSDLLDPSGGSNSHTFGRRSRADIEKDGEDLERAGEVSQKSLKKEASAENQADDHLYYRKDVIDPQIVTDQKKRLLYDKSLKAYYDPETGQYFEMKRQLIPQSSLSQIPGGAKE